MKQSKLLIVFIMIYGLLSCQTTRIKESEKAKDENEHVTEVDELEIGLELLSTHEQYELTMITFINHAKNEDIDSAISMISPNMIEVNGVEAAKEFLKYEVIPFFKIHVEINNMKSIAGATDSFGNNGTSFYYYSTDNKGNNRPFTIYVILENDNLVIANIIVNEFVKGRHEAIE